MARDGRPSETFAARFPVRRFDAILGAAPYVRRTVPASQVSVLSDSNQVGSCALHFVLVDEGTSPDSPRFKATLEAVDQSIFRADPGNPGDLTPVVAYELGRFEFGFQLRGEMERKSARLVEVLHGAVLKELCAAPLPVRL